MVRTALRLPTRETLSLVAGLLSITAGFLLAWVVMLQASGTWTSGLCSESTGLLNHCPLCYPAAAAAIGAVVAWGMLAAGYGRDEPAT
jgi:hypothetical protein